MPELTRSAADPAARAPGAPEWLLEVRRVGKSFPGVTALAEVNLRLRAGSVHAVVGENGAGKSTLMNIIAGLIRPDSGELLWRGAALRLRSPRDALAHGIAMIHQELNLLPSMSVAENIWIGREPLTALALVRHGELRRRTRALLTGLGIDLDPDAAVGSLSIAARQLLEIAKALSHASQLLIMDEPTSALSEADARRLFGLIADLKAQGKGILYITHRMEDLYRIADEITVLRDGRVVGSGSAAELPRQVVIRLMVGRELSLTVPRAAAQRGAVALAARSLTLAPYFREVSFELHAGEVLGVAGLIGAGRSELAETLFGARRPDGGSLAVAGREVRIDSPRTATALGLAFVTEDRKESGCFLPLSVLENLQIAVLAGEYLRLGFVRERALQRACHAVSESLRIKTPDLAECIGNLSGGNQQKVLIGRWLLRQPQIFLLDEPTRGVDVGAKAEIHQLIGRLVERGAAVLMISSELPEVLSMSDRVMVMRAGRVSGILERAAADPVRVMELAAA